MRRARCVAAVVLVLVARPALVWADITAEEPAVTPTAPLEPAAPPPGEPPSAPPLLAPLPGTASTSAAAPAPEPPAGWPSLEDRWPLEAVRRPLTLPAGMASLAVSLSSFRPNHLTNVDPRTGALYQFHPSANVGVGLRFGIRDRFQMGASMPRLLCLDSEAPSGCTGVNRFNGTGASAHVLAVRGPHTQVASSVSVAVSRSSPYVYRWAAGGTVKVTLDDTAFTVSPSVARDINPVAFPPINPWLAYVPIGMNLQITQRTVIYGVVEPWGALDQLSSGIALELYGGAAYTFRRIGEVVLDAGIYNVLAEPDWSSAVPGSFALLSLVFWRQ